MFFCVSGRGGGSTATLRALNRETLFAFVQVVDAMANRPSEIQRAHEVLRECMAKMANTLSALRSKQALVEVKKGLREQKAAAEEGAREVFENLLAGLERVKEKIDAAAPS